MLLVPGHFSPPSLVLWYAGCKIVCNLPNWKSKGVTHVSCTHQVQDKLISGNQNPEWSCKSIYGRQTLIGIQIMFMMWKFAGKVWWDESLVGRERERSATVFEEPVGKLLLCIRKTLVVKTQNTKYKNTEKYRNIEIQNTKYKITHTKTSSQAPSYARRLQPETMTHWLARWQE